MLKGIPALISPLLLQVLRAMGHGDDIAVVDANFPADAMAQRLVRLDGHPAPLVVESILQLLPIDDFRPDPLRCMAVVDTPKVKPDVILEFEQIACRIEGRALSACALEREKFYEQARQAYAVVATGETRLYGNLLITKGVIRQQQASPC